jgi:hypothetical protein
MTERRETTDVLSFLDIIPAQTDNLYVIRGKLWSVLCPRGSVTDYRVQPERIDSHIPVSRASPSLPCPHGVGNHRPLRSQLIVYCRFHCPVSKLSTPRMFGGP